MFVFSAISCWWKRLALRAYGSGLISSMKLDDRKSLQSVKPTKSICVQSLKSAFCPLSRRIMKDVKQIHTYTHKHHIDKQLQVDTWANWDSKVQNQARFFQSLVSHGWPLRRKGLKENFFRICKENEKSDSF